MDISVDFNVAYSVRVDTETGEVRWVLVNVDGPELFQVFNGDVNDNDLPEYLPLDHPIALQAIAIADRVNVTGVARTNGSEFQLSFDLEKA